MGAYSFMPRKIHLITFVPSSSISTTDNSYVPLKIFICVLYGKKTTTKQYPMKKRDPRWRRETSYEEEGSCYEVIRKK